MALPHDTSEFIRRWREKRHQYNANRLEDVFDRFFTLYVLYNFLYEEVAQREEYAFDSDQELALNVARKYLSADVLFADEILQRSARTIISLIQQRTFYIRDTVWDTPRVVKLKTNDPQQWSKGLLEIIYKIRRTTFHGQKTFEPDQRLILEPCVEALERLNDLITAKLEA